MAAKTCAQLLLGCYRVDEVSDPEVFISAFVAVLQRYPKDIMRAAIDPGTGLPSRLKFLPSVAELREECERLVERERADERRARDLEEQWRLRDELEAHERQPPEERARVVDRIKNELRAKGFHFENDRKYHGEMSAQAMAKYGLSQAQWDALPDAKSTWHKIKPNA